MSFTATSKFSAQESFVCTGALFKLTRVKDAVYKSLLSFIRTKIYVLELIDF